MTRPRYESEEDVEREQETLQVFCDKYDREYKKVRRIDSYTPDATIWCEGERTGVVEVKVRTNEIRRYRTYLISKAKLDSIHERWSPLPFVLLVRWTDVAGWVKVTEEAMRDWRVQEGGRTDRGDALDVEDCYMIPIIDFTVFHWW